MSEQIPGKLHTHPDTLFPETRHATTASKSDANMSKQIEAITFTTKHGKEIELTSSKLDKWFANIEANKNDKEKQTDTQELSTQLLGRFGFKNSIEVVKFLRSPAGKSIITMIGDKLAEIASIQEYQKQEMLEAQRRHERMIAFLFLALIHKRDAKAKSLNEFIQQQINQILKKKPETAKPAAATEVNKVLQKQYDSLAESAKYLESMLDDKNRELDLLHQEKLALHSEGAAIEERHAILQDSISELDNDFDVITLAPDDAHNYLTNKITALNAEFHENSKRIGHLEANNNAPEARKLLHKNHGLRLYIDGLDDMHAAHRKEKTLYTSDGEETTSYKDAKYILTPDMKIVKDASGLRCLIGAKQSLEDMDETMKAQARSRFNTLKPEISCIKNLVNHNCKREKEHHRSCTHAVNRQIESTVTEVTLIKNQHHHIKAAQANVLMEMRKVTPDLVKANSMQKSMPNVASGMSVNKIPPNLAMALRQSFESLQKNPTQQNINTLASNLTVMYGQIPGQIRQDLNKIIPGKPIPETLLRSLNRSIYRIKMATDIPELAPEPKANPSWPPKPSPYR